MQGKKNQSSWACQSPSQESMEPPLSSWLIRRYDKEMRGIPLSEIMCFPFPEAPHFPTAAYRASLMATLLSLPASLSITSPFPTFLSEPVQKPKHAFPDPPGLLFSLSRPYSLSATLLLLTSNAKGVASAPPLPYLLPRFYSSQQMCSKALLWAKLVRFLTGFPGRLRVSPLHTSEITQPPKTTWFLLFYLYVQMAYAHVCANAHSCMHVQRPEWESGTPSFFSFFLKPNGWPSLSPNLEWQLWATIPRFTWPLEIQTQVLGLAQQAQLLAEPSAQSLPQFGSLQNLWQTIFTQQFFSSTLSSLVSITTSSEKHTLVIVHPKTFITTLHLPIKCPSTSSNQPSFVHCSPRLSASGPFANSLLHPWYLIVWLAQLAFGKYWLIERLCVKIKWLINEYYLSCNL